VTAISPVAAFGIACGNTLEAVLGALVLRRAAGEHAATLDTSAAIRALVAVAAPISALASAVVGVVTLSLTHALPPNVTLGSALGLWWGGDYLGAIVVAPVLLTWAAPSDVAVGRRRAAELALYGGACILLAELVLGQVVPTSFLPRTSYPYLLFPLVVGAALRTGPRGASLMTLVIAILAVAHAARGGGPFVMPTLPSTAVVLLLYIGVLAATGLALGAVAAQRTRANLAVRNASEHVRAVVQSSPLAIYTRDRAGNVLTWNPAAEALYGWRAAEVVGRPFQDDDTLCALALGGEAIRGMEVTCQRKDGTVATISLSVAPLYNAHGQVTGMLSLAADLTDLRQLEVQFRQAQKMEAVGRLAGGIAHDFNNILTAILTNSELLLANTSLSGGVRHDIDEVKRAAERAAGLTRQLLMFSRQEVIAPRTLDLNALVAESRELLDRLIGEDIRLRTALGSVLGSVRADPTQLQQVIVNLIVNARDAMPKGGAITIETANVVLDRAYAERHLPVVPGPYVMLAVTDTGMGMSQATLAHIFEPFFTTKGVDHGTGLGLATVYGIVKRSRGYIWVYSEPGKGATFKIYLPRVVDVPQVVAAAKEPPAPSRGSEVVLLVEDDEHVLRSTMRALAERGYTVISATNGLEALHLAESHRGPIHVLVTDVVMPGMNGREVALMLEATRPDMKVLYVSGYPDASIVYQGLLAPGLAFLQKPFAPEALARKVRDVLAP